MRLRMSSFVFDPPSFEKQFFAASYVLGSREFSILKIKLRASKDALPHFNFLF